MNSLILCEGSTDYVLLQYFMRKMHGWQDGTKGKFRVGENKSRDLVKADDVLTIASVGGCSQLEPGLHNALQRNLFSSPTDKDYFTKLAIVMDRDDCQTNEKFIACIENTLEQYSVAHGLLKHNDWVQCHMSTVAGNSIDFHLLLLVVPFEGTGAMETFLLNTISEADSYDMRLVQVGNEFVDNIADPERRYLTKRRYITKAKFDVFFSIRTAAEQFVERQNILKNIPWEKYPALQRDFCKLREL